MDQDLTVNLTGQTKFNYEKYKSEEALPVIKMQEYRDLLKTPKLKVYFSISFFIVFLQFTYSINFLTFLQH